MPQASDAVGPAVVRSRLTGAILGPDGGGPRLTTVVAPAGYGKSVLLRQLEARAGSLPVAVPTVTISLKHCDHHPSLVLDLLVAALQKRLPRADLSGLIDLKRTAALAQFGALLPKLLTQSLDTSGVASALLLFDDVETAVAGEPLGAMIADLLRAQPDRVRLVLASRQDLTFDLSGPRGRGELLELTGRDLALTEDEVAEYLTTATGKEPSAALTARALDRTRGWPAVLSAITAHLPAPAEPGPAGPSTLLDAIEGRSEASSAAIAEFVAERILAEYPPLLQYFTKVVSVLDRIEPDAVRGLFVDSAVSPRGRLGSARFVISLPVEQIPGYLARLAQTQLLQPVVTAEGPTGELELNPILRESLRRLLKSEDPRVFREAHRRAAASREPRQCTPDPVAIGHLLAAGDLDQVLALLEEQAEFFFASGEQVRLGAWLSELEAHYASLPFWANYYAGRIDVAAGLWDSARARLDTCRTQLAERRGAASASDGWQWQPRLQLGYAALYWRRGVPTEASTYCRRGLDFLQRLSLPADVLAAHADEIARIQLDLLNLLGTVRMETGAYDKARQVCLEARDLAQERGFGPEEAVALRNLGRIAARQGRIREAREHLERARDRVPEEEAPALHASLRYVGGLTDHMEGAHAEARAGVQAALGQLNGTASPELTAAMQADLGLLVFAAGDAKQAGKICRSAVLALAEVTDAKVQVEVLDTSAVVLARSGETQRAAALVEKAAPTVKGLLRGDTYAVARHEEARAELSASRERLDRALEFVGGSIERYARLGCEWHAARLSWRRALWLHMQFADGASETPGGVNEDLDKACSAALAHGYRFETGPEYHELLQVGATFGSEATRDRCHAWLATLPVAVQEQGLSDRAAARYRDYRRRAELADDYVVSNRRERRGANARQVEQVIQEATPETLVLVAHEQYLILEGEHVPLGEKRVILPLLLHFLRFPDTVFTMDQLAAEVWGAEDGRTSMQTKVKVAISRLRALLGKDRNYVITSRVELPDGSGSVVGYGLAPQLEFQLVEQIVDED
ncbi:MAG: tetratricopeptide repeat protein [Myxococcota bacterium]